MYLEMNLDEKYFYDTIKGIKCIEFRLNDKKRNELKIGDHILFKNRVNSNEVVKVIITNIYYNIDFQNLIMNVDSSKFPYSKYELIDLLSEIYSAEKICEFGTIAIEFKLE